MNERTTVFKLIGKDKVGSPHSAEVDNGKGGAGAFLDMLRAVSCGTSLRASVMPIPN